MRELIFEYLWTKIKKDITMKNYFVKTLLFLPLISILTSCTGSRNTSLICGNFILNENTNRTELSQHKLTKGYLNIQAIPEKEYEEFNGINTVQSYVADDEGNRFYNIVLSLEIDNLFSTCQLKDLKKSLGRPNSYSFGVSLESEQFSFYFEAGLTLDLTIQTSYLFQSTSKPSNLEGISFQNFEINIDFIEKQEKI